MKSAGKQISYYEGWKLKQTGKCGQRFNIFFKATYPLNPNCTIYNY